MINLLPTSRKHDISFHPSGRIDISANVARRLALAPGDVIGIAAESGECYIYVRLRAGRYAGRHEGRVWPTSGGRGSFRAQSKKLARAFLAAAGARGPLRCPCGAALTRDNTTYITIIYNCPL